MKMVFDPARSRVRIRTYAEGFFSKLAHDLELVCGSVSGSAERSAEKSGTASVEVPVFGIEIGGVLKDGHVDSKKMSGFERNECIAKMRRDVFQAGSQPNAVVRVGVTADGDHARLRLEFPNGRTLSRDVSFQLAEEGNGVRVSGTFPLSLESIGSVTVRGPMNAFRVKDGIDLLFDAVFAPA